MIQLLPLIENYLAGATALRRAVSGMTREQLLARPVAGKWSTMEVVCHLSDFEPIFAVRMKLVIAEDRPALTSADENQFATTLAYQERDLEEELKIVDTTRSQMARILRKQPDTVLTREGVHSVRGPLPLEKILAGATNHIQHHLPFIAEKRKALGLS
jgi:uncharacterized damage-inducible protein DinB